MDIKSVDLKQLDNHLFLPEKKMSLFILAKNCSLESTTIVNYLHVFLYKERHIILKKGKWNHIAVVNKESIVGIELD